MISYRNALKLYHRFARSIARNTTVPPCQSPFVSPVSVGSLLGGPYCSVMSTYLADTQTFHVAAGSNYVRGRAPPPWPVSSDAVVLPGQHNESFLKALYEKVERNYEDPCFRAPWTVSPALYSLWRCTSAVTTELFADSMNESGVLQDYCSIDKEDVIFSSRGSWKCVEEIVEGAGGNPLFEPSFIKNLLVTFENGVRKQSPYCRCVLLPLGKRCGVLEHITRLSSEGIFLVSIDEGALPFRNQLQLLSLGARKPKGFSYQRTGLFIWRNRQYLLKHPVPKDVEVVYMKWTCRALLDPLNAKMHFEAFEKAFPPNLRSEVCVSDFFEV